MTTTQQHSTKLLEALAADYERQFPTSKAAHSRACDVLVGGISHGARSFKPYPVRIVDAQGARVTDLDGNEIIDYWQGHYANILGHNPPVVRDRLVKALERGSGLQTGHLEALQTEFAEVLTKALGAERVRFTTAGTLATMYAIMLARAHTGRDLVVKIGGGWHGAQPLALKGVHSTETGFSEVDSLGVPTCTDAEILVTRFGGVDSLRDLFRRHGDRIACFILELCPGRNGFVPATQEYVDTARQLTDKHGAILIFDEVITGFRFCASGMQKLYGVIPDLTTMGKIIGGGMPLSAVLGRRDVMDLASDASERRVWFNGGTFSGHPLCLLAGHTMVSHLVEHESEIYPALASKGERLRAGVEGAFAKHGVLGHCTGRSQPPVAGSSLLAAYFPYQQDHYPASAEDLADPALCDATMDSALKLGLLLQGVYVAHGLGAVSMAHTDEDIDATIAAFDAFAQRAAKSV